MPLTFRGWQKVSTIEYPGKIATVLFVGGCNFRCPFCHNPELVEETDALPRVEDEEVLLYLEKRKGLLDALVITGGEPLLKTDLLSFVKLVKEKGYLVKIDSNGSLWEAFSRLRQEVDQWGIDYKLPFGEYHRVGGEKWKDSTQRVLRELLRTPERLEVRTTIFPPFHSLATLLRMGEEIRDAQVWWWQSFRPEKTLQPEAQKVIPYPPNLLREWQERINQTLGKNLVRIRLAQ
ncbi:MAG: anaerobic ribonucleoside-triphosphate reductase activating protein [Candidatus Caldatribacteriaceae bacterium]